MMRLQLQWRRTAGRPVDRPAVSERLASESAILCGRMLCETVHTAPWPTGLTYLAPNSFVTDSTASAFLSKDDALGLTLAQQQRAAAEVAAHEAATPSLIDRLGGRENIDWKSLNRFLVRVTGHLASPPFRY